MKAILGFAMLAMTLSSVVASADVSRQACHFKDYKFIQQALSQGRILKGAEKKVALQEVLMQEMGPACHALIPDSPGFGIPGTQYSQYEISTGSTRFSLSISVSRITDPGIKISIE